MSANFEMANGDDPKEVAVAAQRSFVAMIRQVVQDVRKTTTAPGLTWEQIDYLLNQAAKKEPTVIVQSEVQ